MLIRAIREWRCGHPIQKGVRNIKGEVIRSDLKSFSVNMAVWWDGDLLRELLDKTG